MRVNRLGTQGTNREESFTAGSVCWVDVSSTDPAGSREFYSGLFGWTYQIHSERRRTQYLTALRGGRPVAGLSGAPVQEGHTGAWTLYLASANVTRTAQVPGSRGGRVLSGPTNVPGQGRVLLGVHRPAPRSVSGSPRDHGRFARPPLDRCIGLSWIPGTARGLMSFLRTCSATSSGRSATASRWTTPPGHVTARRCWAG